VTGLDWQLSLRERSGAADTLQPAPGISASILGYNVNLAELEIHDGLPREARRTFAVALYGSRLAIHCGDRLLADVTADADSEGYAAFARDRRATSGDLSSFEWLDTPQR
jgi:hypothetical protein